MNLITQPGHPLKGQLHLPGDKSISHRAALLAAMAEGESRIENFLVAGVTEAMLRALNGLGVAWRLDRTTLTVQGRGWSEWRSPASPLDCGNSATTLRLLAGALAAAGIPAIVDGSAGLRRRPMGRICDPLQAMGVSISAAEGNTAPLRLAGRPAGQRLLAMDYTLPVASAQVKSCLLLAGLRAAGPLVLREPGPSRDHSERMLRSLGISVETEVLELGCDRQYLTRLTPPEQLRLPPLQLSLPGDISAAAFVLVAGLIVPGSELVLHGIGLNPTRTGLIEVLQAMGAQLEILERSERQGEPVGDLHVRASQLHGVQVGGDQVVRMIDEFPALAAAAAFAQGTTRVVDAGELRHKESDRITALCQEMRALGAQVHETPDGFEIQGQDCLPGGTVESHGDHRLAMALAVAGLACQGRVTVQGAEMISESFPSFVDTLQSLGAGLTTRAA